MKTRIQDTIVGVAGLTFWVVIISAIATGMWGKPWSTPDVPTCHPDSAWAKLC